MSEYKDNRSEATKKADREQIVPPHLELSVTSSGDEEKTEDFQREEDLYSDEKMLADADKPPWENGGKLEEY
jgi:hypothetical protein